LAVRVSPVRILVIGGTRFVGRAFVEEAARRGHDITLFHRGNAEPDDLVEVEHLHGDRDGGLDVLSGRRWDAALDVCAYIPRAVNELAAVIGGSVSHYTLVSTLSVYDDLPVGATESAPMFGPPFPRSEEVTGETYGPLKVACEQEAQKEFDGRLLIIRPGYIVGPHDYSDRFTYYVRRAAAGGEMLAPGPPEEPFQGVDVRDLGIFMLDRMEADDVNDYGVVGPGGRVTMRDLLETARDLARADTTLAWATPDFLGARGDVDRLFPMWHPNEPGAHTFDASKAIAAGLRHRPFRETIADTLAWDRGRGSPPLRAGLSADEERDLLAARRSSSSTKP
jgi:2'-hydroxyisoflavone reductase